MRFSPPEAWQTTPLFDDGASYFRRPEHISVADWATKYRKLSTSYAARTGRFDPWITPYFYCENSPAEALDSGEFESVVIMASAQLAKTELLINTCFRDAMTYPCPIMIIEPDEDLAKEVGSGRLVNVINTTPELREIFDKSNLEDGEKQNTARVKKFVGGVIVIASARAASDLRGRPVRTILGDEIDSWPADVQGEGDPIGLAAERGNTYGVDRRMLLISTPTDTNSRIKAEYDLGSRMIFELPCPFCGHFEELHWQRMNRDVAAQVCGGKKKGGCGSLIDEEHKRSMLAGGRWVTERNKKTDGVWDKKIASFRISGLYSPFVTWDEIIQKHINAIGNPLRMRTWTNLSLGEVYIDKTTKLMPDKLRETCGDEDDPIPDERIIFVGAGVDIQGDRLEIYIEGRDAQDRVTGLEWKKIPGGTDSHDTPAFEDLAEFVKNYEVELADGRKLKIDALSIDSGWRPDSAYGFVRRMEATVSHCRFFATKGAPTVSAPLAGLKSRISSSKHPYAPSFLYNCGSQVAKNLLFSRLTQKDRRLPASYNFPGESWGAAWWNGLAAEERVSRRVRGREEVLWEKPKGSGRRNEPIDLCVLAMHSQARYPQIRKVIEAREKKRLRYSETEPARSARMESTGKQRERDLDSVPDRVAAIEEEVRNKTKLPTDQYGMPVLPHQQGFKSKPKTRRPARKSRRQQLFGD